MNVGVAVFPGTNCDRDVLAACGRQRDWRAVACWHDAPLPAGLDVLVVPGGFSHGDALRAGALAALSPMMAAVRDFAAGGGHVLGICNGFQILCEAGLLPGVLRRNVGGRFVCRDMRVRVERRDTAFTNACGDALSLPIAHHSGCYHADGATLDALEREGRVLFRYADGNPNGSARDIAGVMSECGRIAGLMPHPERACEALLGGTDGLGILASLAAAVRVAA